MCSRSLDLIEGGKERLNIGGRLVRQFLASVLKSKDIHMFIHLPSVHPSGSATGYYNNS